VQARDHASRRKSYVPGSWLPGGLRTIKSRQTGAGGKVLVDKIVDETIKDYENEPTGIGGIESELSYILNHSNRFRFTIADMLAILEADFDKRARILDISTYCGFVAVALSKAGYSVNATDVPAVFNCEGLVTKLTKYDIHFKGSDLVNEMPYADSTFEIISCCETLEHLNFNPIIALKHINRILKPGGILYLTVPNVSRLYNIYQHLKGKEDNAFIDMFSTRYADGTHPLQSFGVHWHEYTANELHRVLDTAGYRVLELKYVEHLDNYSKFKKCILTVILKLFPHLSETIVVVAVKEHWP
jgi:SAM-dependent methyltransferase